MDHSVKLRWVRALRSGEYKQSKESFLRITQKDHSKIYCCFGVLCELYLREFTGYEFTSPEKGEICDKLFGIPNVLPVPVMKWAGLQSSVGPILEYNKEQPVTLATLNDLGYDFQTLADIIEEYL